MSDPLTPQPLRAQQIDQAFALVQAILPALSLEEWRHYARQRVAAPERRAGILTVQSGGYIYGLFGYRMETDPPVGQRLRLETFIVAELCHPAGVAATLLTALARLLRELGCAVIDLTRPDDAQLTASERRWLPTRWAGPWYQPGSQNSCQRLTAPESVVRAAAANDNQLL